ncbi:hypothetical protein FRC07_012950, partial [Ceratobasidium sp. 392]
MTSKLTQLKDTLDTTATEIEHELALSWHKRFFKFLRDPGTITDFQDQVNRSINLFQLSAVTATATMVQGIVNANVTIVAALSGIRADTSAVAAETTRKAAQQDVRAALDKLPRIHGSSWDSSRTCLNNTRVDLIKRLLAWIDEPAKSGGAEIMLLTAVAGAGKTTVAHTIAYECHQKGQLGSSFFFDYETAGRNNPNVLFTTIASDLSTRRGRLARHIGFAIQEDSSLPTAPLSRQFKELILKPCRKLPLDRKVVIVIDALDEAWSNDLLCILRDQLFKLPNCFRVLLTSRMRPELNSLLGKAHVHQTELNIGANFNLNDIAMFASIKLRQLSKDRGLGDNWPGEPLRTEFVKKAGGLFLWVTVVYEYLRGRNDPTHELSLLVSANLPTSSAEDQMHKLYARILESFIGDPADRSFIADYHRVMGAAIATKTPLTIAAMEELYQKSPLSLEFTLQKLSPLLTGMRKVDHASQP